MASTSLFAQHDRIWESNRFVYPVISRRSRGLSIGVNLNPDGVCNFDCVYCNVDRSRPIPRLQVDLEVLERELAALLDATVDGSLYAHGPLSATPAELRRLNDVALSGDGEPTASPVFQKSCRLIDRLLRERGLEAVKIVVITNATLFERPDVREGMAFLAEVNSEIWAKLDAGTQAWYEKVDRSRIPLDRIEANLLSLGRLRPIVIQTMLLRIAGELPPPEEIDAWLERLRTLQQQGCRIDYVQLYTVARRVAESWATPAAPELLEAVATRVRELGLRAETFPAPT